MTRTIFLRGGLALLLVFTLGGVLFWRIPGAEEPAPEASSVAAPSAEREKQSEERRSPIFPVADDARIAFEDFLFAGVDERSSYREFALKLATGKTQLLAATYLDEPDWIDDRNDDAALIFRLADLNASFRHNVVVDLPPRGNWSQNRLHIGDFAQDYCGDIAVVISLRNQRIFAMTKIPSSEIDLTASHCPLRPEGFLADKARYGKREEPDDFSAYCAVRRECLQAYYGKPENQAQLLPGWLPEVTGVALR